MPDLPISGLPALTALSDDDLLVVVDDPGGSPATKRITVANAKAGLGGLRSRPTLAQQTYPGLPGRILEYADGVTPNGGFVFGTPIQVDAATTFDAYLLQVTGAGSADARAAVAIYSCDTPGSWAIGTSATKVAGTEVTNINVSATGGVTATLGSAQTLAVGRYWIVHLFTATTVPQVWQKRGADYILGSNWSPYAANVGWLFATGASSLPASVTVSAGNGHDKGPVAMMRPA